MNFEPHSIEIRKAATEFALAHSARAASKKYGIARSTIQLWIKKKKKSEIIKSHIKPKLGKFAPVSRVMVLPDMHHPWCHPDGLAFLKAVRDAYKPTHIVCLGDEVDLHSMSRYPKEPDAPNVSREISEAIEALTPFYREFPDMMVCESNHTLRLWKRAFEAGLPSSFLPTVAKVLNAPDGWIWRRHWEIDGVFYHHGDMGVSGQMAHVQLMKKLKQSVVIGHLHSYAGVNYEGTFFAMNTGCLIDPEAMCFRYAKNLPIPVSLGCGIVIGGKHAHFIPMHTNSEGRWTHTL